MKKSIFGSKILLLALGLFGLLGCSSGERQQLRGGSFSGNMVNGQSSTDGQYAGYIVVEDLTAEEFYHEIYKMVNYAPPEYGADGDIVNDIEVGDISLDPFNDNLETGVFLQIFSDIDLSQITKLTSILESVDLKIEVVDSLVFDEDLDPIQIHMGKTNEHTQTATAKSENNQLILEFTDTFGSIRLSGELNENSGYYEGELSYINTYTSSGSVRKFKIPLVQIKSN